ncbi:uncharacterized protein LOC125034912 [Penaeus chinensis]|uniref:uncharacterized protein LOC125034912 n=1 Tax=Penaeus chinensis TaxID=139456 RepID=UPI001FB74F16|nr:uncharacterized protein LOC125034912 [Penaeus chinensis]
MCPHPHIARTTIPTPHDPPSTPPHSHHSHLLPSICVCRFPYKDRVCLVLLKAYIVVFDGPIVDRNTPTPQIYLSSLLVRETEPTSPPGKALTIPSETKRMDALGKPYHTHSQPPVVPVDAESHFRHPTRSVSPIRSLISLTSDWASHVRVPFSISSLGRPAPPISVVLGLSLPHTDLPSYISRSSASSRAPLILKYPNNVAGKELRLCSTRRLSQASSPSHRSGTTVSASLLNAFSLARLYISYRSPVTVPCTFDGSTGTPLLAHPIKTKAQSLQQRQAIKSGMGQPVTRTVPINRPMRLPVNRAKEQVAMKETPRTQRKASLYNPRLPPHQHHTLYSPPCNTTTTPTTNPPPIMVPLTNHTQTKPYTTPPTPLPHHQKTVLKINNYKNATTTEQEPGRYN